MKESPEEKRLRDRMQPSRMSSDGYLGSDTRSPAEIIEEDCAVLTRRSSSPAALAARMASLTECGAAGLGRPVQIDGLEVTVTEDRGKLPCPFSDAWFAGKRITLVRRISDGRTIYWSDLNIHMIEKHGFFEGRGTWFRIEPDELLDMIGDSSDEGGAPARDTRTDPLRSDADF